MMPGVFLVGFINLYDGQVFSWLVILYDARCFLGWLSFMMPGVFLVGYPL